MNFQGGLTAMGDLSALKPRRSGRYRGPNPASHFDHAHLRAPTHRKWLCPDWSRSTGTDLRRVRGSNLKSKPPAPLLRDFVTNTFLPWSRANKRTCEKIYRSQSILAFFGKYRLDEISPAQIEKFKMKRQQTPTKNRSERRPATVNRERENLSRMFNLAIDMGIPLTNPCLKVQSLSEDNERNRYLSEAEERRLLDVLQGRRKHLRSIVLIDLQTGLRKQEL